MQNGVIVQLEDVKDGEELNSNGKEKMLHTGEIIALVFLFYSVFIKGDVKFLSRIYNDESQVSIFLKIIFA